MGSPPDKLDYVINEYAISYGRKSLSKAFQPPAAKLVPDAIALVDSFLEVFSSPHHYWYKLKRDWCLYRYLDGGDRRVNAAYRQSFFADVAVGGLSRRQCLHRWPKSD